jgi:hypothetical protein
MGRTVSCPRNAIAKTYTHVEVGDDGDYFEWDEFEDSLRYAIEAVFNLGKQHRINVYRDEDKGLYHAYGHVIGMSEYCGLLCLWIVQSDRHEPDEEDATERLARGLLICNSDALLEKVVTEMGLTNLFKVGTFSNGEAVFEKRAA